VNKIKYFHLLALLFSFIYTGQSIISYEMKAAEGKGDSRNYFENFLDVNYFFDNGLYLFTQLEYSSPPLLGLKTKSIGDNLTGTIVVWQQDKLVPCNKSEDELVMGVIKNGKDEPIVLGAEPVLVTGKVKVGDYIVTSDKIGHGKSVKRGYLLKKDLFGKVIAQALEKSDDSESCLIKCMIRKM